MRKFLLLLFLVTISVTSYALDIGDKAPALNIDKWVVGGGDNIDPTKSDDKTVYIVEVWSVTCPPCVRTIPILNDISKRYKDKNVVVVSFTTDSIEEVNEFTKDHPIEYNSFIDKDGETFIKYMAADNRNTIPHAFIFDKSGTLVWIGNPLDNIENVLNNVLSGKLDAKLATEIKTVKEELQAAFQEQNIDAVFSLLDKLQALEPENVTTYLLKARLFQDTGDKDKVAETLNSWYKNCYNNPQALVILATIASQQGDLSSRNPALALSAAKRANEITQGKDLESVVVLSEVYSLIGRFDLAIDCINSSLNKLSDTDQKSILPTIIEYYKNLESVGKNPDADYK